MVKYIKSNTGFLITLVFIAVVIFVPSFKALLLQGMMKTGFYNPAIIEDTNDINHVPDVSFTTSDGQIVNLANTQGKVVFLNFWATWCPPCIAEMPSIIALKNKIADKQNVIFVMVDADNNLNKSEVFMRNKNFDIEVYRQQGQVPENLFSGTLPTTLIINKKGQIVLKHTGLGNYDTTEMLNLLNSLSSENYDEPSRSKK